jgi:hypothetical protein
MRRKKQENFSKIRLNLLTLTLPFPLKRKRRSGEIVSGVPIMARLYHIFFFSFFFLISEFDSTRAEPFKIIEGAFFWSSSNLTEIQPVQPKQDSKNVRGKKVQPLKNQSYKNYFDQHGTHSTYPFLQSMKEVDLSIAEIKDGYILFQRGGRKVPLNASPFPPGANPVPPYLLSTPNREWVLAIYPYYLYQNKDNRYLTEIYSDQGTLLTTYDSLPTHVSLNHPSLFIAPERSGCCESLKWSIRFYHIRQGSVSEYSCPEGFCGDILFTKLGDKGTFLIVQEIVGKVDEIGASMQTNFYVVENDGSLSASGKTLYALREPGINRQRLDSLSPFAISNLISIDPLPEKGNWVIHFGAGGQKRVLKLASICKDQAPAMVFLLPKDPSMNAEREVVEVDGRPLGFLPLLGVAKPGQIPFEISSKDGRKGGSPKEVRSDFVNILMY